MLLIENGLYLVGVPYVSQGTKWREGRDDTICPAVYPRFCRSVESNELLVMTLSLTLVVRKRLSFLPLI